MAIHFQHDLEYPADECVGNVSVEEIGHAVHEDHPRIFPLRRLTQALLPYAHRKRIRMILGRVYDWQMTSVHGGEAAVRERVRIAVVAARAHLRTAGDRIPG